MSERRERRGNTGVPVIASSPTHSIETRTHRRLVGRGSAECGKRRVGDVGMSTLVVRGTCERGVHNHKIEPLVGHICNYLGGGLLPRASCSPCGIGSIEQRSDRR